MKRMLRIRVLTIAFAVMLLPQFSTAQKENGNKSYEDPAARARWRFQQRADANGEIPADALMRAKEQMDRLRTVAPPDRDAGISEWEWLGPGNIGGRIRTILIHPTSPNIMWIGSVSGGIWRTDNGGGHWYPIADFMANIGVTSIVMDPTNFNTMYASTGEGFFPGSSAPQGAGIFKSIDGGLTWNQLAATSSFILVNRLAHHPTVANTLLAAVASPAGIYRSADGGATWTPAIVPSAGATDVKYHPLFPNNVLAGTATDLYFSSNGGTGWTRQTTGAAGKLPNSPGRCEVAFAPSTGATMYASLDRNGGEVWHGTAGATTWTLMNTGTNYFMSGSVPPTSQGAYDNAIWVDPFDPNLLIVGGIDLWRSTNGGTTLRKISRWQNYHNGGPQNSAHADQHAIVHHPGFNGTTNRIVYFGNDGGIQVALDVYTVDSTSGWTNLANNLGITQFYGGAAAPNGSLIVGGAQDNDKLHYTPQNGIHNWRQPQFGDGGFAAIDPINNNRVYGEFIYLDIRRSDNGGMSYVQKISGLGDATNANLAAFIAPFVMDPNNPSTLVAGGKRIWQTTNAAESWSELRDSLPDGQLCSAIDIAQGNSSVIWVGYSRGRVSRTFNGGGAWFDVTTAALPTGRVVTDIAVNPSNPAEVVITYGGYQNRSVWLTTNNGFDWVLRQGTAPFNLPAIQINTVRYNPTNTNWIYVGTDLGVLASEDKGLTWSISPRLAGHEGPVNVEVDELFWQGSDHLIAATHGRGMFRARILSTVYVDIANTGTEDGTLLHPYRTIQAAINAAGSGSTISIATGVYPQAPLIFWKRGRVESRNGVVQIIGPAAKPILPVIKEEPLTPTVPNEPGKENE
jgi:photosystem II stability/assembly factor-like uncharacterized protein